MVIPEVIPMLYYYYSYTRRDFLTFTLISRVVFLLRNSNTAHIVRSSPYCKCGNSEIKLNNTTKND